MPKLTIDGREVEVEEGTSVLQACERLGIEIPRFCYHERLSIAGSCRMCLVEIEGKDRLVPSCATPCADGMVVRTESRAVLDARQGVLEMLLLNHPLDCAVCDQGGECDLQDLAFLDGRDRSRTRETRRRVRDKDFGPLIASAMSRCILCTRCVRFMDEIAGTPVLGVVGRGEDAEIALVREGPLLSELSGNLIDICPVGALTNKQAAFSFRPWELRRTESIDVLDAVGSNIRVDSRDNKVVRVLPRLNEEINEEWIADKTRFACDGLSARRLETPFVRQDGRLRPAEWDEALELIGKRMKDLAPERVGAIAGDLADCESMFALERLMRKLDSPNLDCRQDGALYDVSARCGYIMNSTIAGIEKADAILLVGTNPRHEAPLVNARIRKRWRAGGCPVGLIGKEVELGYPLRHIGHSSVALRDLADGRYPFGEFLKKAQNPMLILGAGALARPDGAAIQALARDVAEKYGMVREDWNGFNVLQLAAARTGGLDLGFLPETRGMAVAAMIEAAGNDALDALYLLGADEIDVRASDRLFIVYQGHHADRGAAQADVVLPSAAYTEKDATYVNTEGRPQRTRRSVSPPESAREDWEIVRAVSHVLGKDLFYGSFDELREKMVAQVPRFAREGTVEKAPWKPFGARATLSLAPFVSAVPDYHMSDPVSRASVTMAACSAALKALRQEGAE